MKADRLTRKTHFKRHAELPETNLRVFDLTRDSGADKQPVEGLYLGQLCLEPAEYDEVITRPYSFQTEKDVFAWSASVIAESPTASALLRAVAEDGWTAGLADLHGGGFYLDVTGKQLLLDHFSLTPAALGRSLYFRNAFLTTMIRALRDIWHELQAEPFEDHYGPEDVLMLERVRAADCDTVAVMAGWELRGAGYSDVWRHLIGSQEGDMALIFTQFLERDPSALFDGSALAYAFRQWYVDENRVDGCDHETLETLDEILLASEERNPFGRRPLRGTDLEGLSILPDGTCYLAGLGATIMGDPFFAGLHDEINQTHLWQIVYDTETTIVNNVPFRDSKLARKIFPGAESLKSFR